MDIGDDITNSLQVGKVTLDPCNQLVLALYELHLLQNGQPCQRMVDRRKSGSNVVARQQKTQLLSLKLGSVVWRLFLRRLRLLSVCHGVPPAGGLVRICLTRARRYAPGSIA